MVRRQRGQCGTCSVVRDIFQTNSGASRTPVAATADTGAGGNRFSEGRTFCRLFLVPGANRSRLKWKCTGNFVTRLQWVSRLAALVSARDPTLIATIGAAESDGVQPYIDNDLYGLLLHVRSLGGRLRTGAESSGASTNQREGYRTAARSLAGFDGATEG